MTKPIASLTLTAVPATGDAFEFVIAVGEPYLDRNGVWRCAATSDPLQRRLAPAGGADSFQALCLAVALLRSLLKAFEQEGGSFLFEGERWTTEAYPIGRFKSR